jgi:internalin A
VLPDWIGSLSNLTTLYVWGNQLTVLPESLGSMTNLTGLDIGGNQLTVLPEWLGSMTNLTTLGLWGNQLAVLPEWIGSLTNLTELYLNGNQLAVLPDWIGSLSNLTTLYVWGNQLTVLPESLGSMTNLIKLRLDGNRLTVLPESLGPLTNLTELRLDGNQLISPPAEIVASGSRAVLAFLRDVAGSPAARSWSSKLLVLGEATVGKTSLAKRLTGGTYDPDEDQTHGVHLDLLSLEHPTEPGVVMELTLWDFGGQLEYRATQRFYLSDRSLFILVWNARARWRDGKLLAWLDVITARAPQSPILVVATHGDEPSAATLPDDLRERYPRVKGVVTIDAKSGTGMSQLREAIRQHSADLPLMGVRWPASWVAAIEAVRGLPGDAATAQQMRDTMAAAGVREPEAQRAIARALHDLGEIVYFADDPELNRRVILHPVWLDKRITRVLDSKQVADARGVLTRAERDRLWADLDDPDLHERLVRMMERFDLAYRIGDTEHSEDVALVVERLGDTRPSGVDNNWDQALKEPGAREIGIVYKLRSRQAGIPTWFIARQHRYTTNLHWAHGVLLRDRDPRHPAYALLIDDEREQPTVTLRVRGRYPVHFISVLIETFENVTEHRYPGLIEQRLVPCACAGPTAGACGHNFDLDELIDEATDLDSRTDQQVRCPRSRRWIDARVMLDGLYGSGISNRLDQLAHAVADNAHAVAEQRGTLERIEQQQLDTLNGMRTLLARRTQTGEHCPSLFAVEDLSRTGRLRRRTLRLSLWCEWPYSPGPHALADGEGVYTLTSMPDWLRDYLPFLKALAATLSIAAPLVAPTLTALGTQLTDRAKAGFETADKLLDTLSELHVPDQEPGLWQPIAGQGPTPYAEVGADFRALRNALHRLDPNDDWGGLSAVARPEDRSIVYLCREHARALDYPYQNTNKTLTIK